MVAVATFREIYDVFCLVYIAFLGSLPGHVLHVPFAVFVISIREISNK
jgi:hypothetical protein